MDVLYIILNHLIWRSGIYHLFGKIEEGNYHIEQCKNLPKVLKKINTLTSDYATNINQNKCTLMEKEMGKYGDQDESSKI